MPTFVVGTGRCGSSLLSKMLADHQDVLSLSEFFNVIGSENAFSRESLDGKELWRLLSVPSVEAVKILEAEAIPEIRFRGARIRRDWADIPPLLLIPLPLLSRDPDNLFGELGTAVRELPRANTAAAYQFTFDWLRNRLQKRIWIERSGGSLQFVERLLALWPNARFVHLWRDGPNCALSMHKHPYFRALVARLRAPTCGTSAVPAVSAMPLPAFGTYWSAAMIRGLSVLGNLDAARVLHISFSALTTAPSRVLRQVAEFIGIEAGPCWLERAGSRVHAVPTQLETVDAEIRRALERACRPGARAVRDAGLPE